MTIYQGSTVYREEHKELWGAPELLPMPNVYAKYAPALLILLVWMQLVVDAYYVRWYYLGLGIGSIFHIDNHQYNIN